MIEIRFFVQSMAQNPLLFICPCKSAIGEPSAQILVGDFQELNFCRYSYLDVTRFSAAAMMVNNTAYTKCVRAFISKIIIFY